MNVPVQLPVPFSLIHLSLLPCQPHGLNSPPEQDMFLGIAGRAYNVPVLHEPNTSLGSNHFHLQSEMAHMR